MTKDDDDTLCYRSELEAAVLAEREACAKICEDLHPGLATRVAAEYIRARGQG